MFTGRTDAEAEASILWPADAKSRLIGKDSDARKTEGSNPLQYSCLENPMGGGAW